MERFPDGAYRAQAADLLSAVRTERAAQYSPLSRDAHGYVRQSETPFADLSAAQADARRRADADARTTLCAPQSEFERLSGMDLALGAYDCRPSRGGWVCALDFSAQCRLEERALAEICG